MIGFFLLSVVALGGATADAATLNACGTIAGAATWTANNVYLVDNCATIVAAGGTLTIQPGTVVKLGAARAVMLVQGALGAQGTAGAPITFTSWRDDSRGGDTNGDGASAGAAGDWAGIRFAAGSQGTLAYVDVAYGGSGAFDHGGVYNSALVETASSAVTLDHVALRRSARNGLYANAASVAVSFGQVRDNGEYGLYYNGVDGVVPLTVSDTSFSGNGIQAGQISFRDRPGSIVFERCTASGARNAIRVSGRLTDGSVRWSNGAGLPLWVEGGAIIAPDAALRLDPGTVMKFAGVRDVLLIEGELEAQGTAEAVVAFTSHADDSRGGDTNGDRAATTTQKGQWGAVRFAAGSSGELTHILAAFGGSGAFDHVGRYSNAIIEAYSSDVNIAHATLHGSGLNGLYADGASVAVTDGQITDNAHSGLFYRAPDPNVPLEVRDTSFSGNGIQAGGLQFLDAAASVTFADNVGIGPRNGVHVSGRLNGGFLRWDNGDALPLVVDGGFNIAPATMLKLEPGSVVKFTGVRDVLLVEGVLEALGSSGAEIVFTSIADDAHGGDTNGDGPSSGSPGAWAGLRFLAGSQGALSHFFTGYGGSGAFDSYGHYNLALIESDSSAVVLDHCTLRSSHHDGLYATNASVAVSFCTITDNRLYGLRYVGIDPLVPLVVTDNTFGGSTGGASRVVLNGNPAEITFARNSGTGGGFTGGFSLSGTIDASTVWDNTGSLPLVIDGGLTVAEGATLTAKPGTVIKFAGVRDVLLIAGELVAIGTEGAGIAFTGLADDAHGGDTNGDGPGAATAGQWGGLRFLAGSRGDLAHVFFGYGGSGAFDHRGRYNTAMIESSSSDVLLRNATIHASRIDGLRAEGASVSVSDSAVTENVAYGLRYAGIDPEAPLAVIGNAFAGNGAHGGWLQIASGGTVVAADNTAGGPKSGFRVSGTLASGSLEWDCPEQPLVVEGGLAIAAGASFDIGAGAVVKFAGTRDVLQVNGSVDGRGTAAAPIVLTSLADDAYAGDTNGDGPSAGARGQWGSLRVLGGRVDLRYATIAHGGSGAFDHFGIYGIGMVDLRGGETSVTHGAVRSSAQVGVRAEAAGAVLSYNSIGDHAGNAIQAATGTSVDARRNWWGDASGPYHPSLNAGGKGGSVGNGVFFEPWLDRYAWLEPTAALLHGIARLSWRAFDTEATALGVDVTAASSLDSLVFGRGLLGTGSLEWDTNQVAGGPYELRASFRDLEGHGLAELPLAVVVNNDPAIEWHGGRVTGGEIWSAARLHVVESDVIIGAGASVFIEPGAVVKFLPGVRLIIEAGGIVEAPATIEDPIILTSIGDDSAWGDTNLDGAARLPRPGDWGGAQLDPGGEFDRNEFVDIRFSQATHGGTLATDQTWLGSLLHRVTADVVVPSGVTLTIEAGAIVKFDARLGIVLQPGARLLAAGVVAQPVVFTSYRDDAVGGDSNGDGDSTAPAPGDWRWIYVDGAEAVFDHVELRYGAGTVSGNWDQTGMIRTNGTASLAIRNSLLRDALFDGILAWGGPVLVQSTILTNIDRAISAHPGSPVEVVHCTVDGNRIGLLIHGGTLDVVNTGVSNSAESGIQYDFGSLGSVRHSNVWKPIGSTSVNYRNTADRTGTDGNLSVDPVYVARLQGNLRLDYRSPLIDAADGTRAPPRDHFGAPRYDDPRSPNTGIAASGGAFADIGAFEFVESAPSPIDLVVASVSGPGVAVAGEMVRVSWNVTNVGTAEAVGPWHDTVHLVRGSAASPEVVFAAEVLVGQGRRLGPGQSLAVSADVRVPGSIVAEHHWQVVTNARAEVFEGANRANNATQSLAGVAVDLPEFVIGGASLERRFDGAGEPHWFKLLPEAGDDVLVRLDRAGTAGVTELYIARGYVPERQRFDARQQEGAAADVTVLAAGASAQTYYVLAYPASLPVGSEAFSIRATRVPFSIESVNPAEVGNAGQVTLAIRGGQLREGMAFEIVDARGGVHAALSVFVVDSSLAYATFDLEGLPVGAYRVRVSDGPEAALSPSTTTVAAGRPGRVRVALVMPEALRPDWTGMVTVQYGNDGGADVVAPLLALSVQNARLRLPGRTDFVYGTVQLLGINRQGPAGVLPPGAHGTITVEMQPSVNSGTIAARLWVLSDPDQEWAWNAVKSAMRPGFVPTDAWDAVFANFTDRVGTTVGPYNAALADDATHLSRLGEYTADVQRLLAFELNQAGLEDLTRRYTLGAFGRGVASWWEVAIRQTAIDTLTVGVGNRLRFFRRQSDGSYSGIGRESGALTATGGGYELREADGTVSAFRSDGALDYVEDRNRNRVTLVYTEGTVASLELPNGDSYVLGRDARGRVDQITDPVGRVTSYSYDTSGEHLVGVTDPDGTTTFSYSDPITPAAAHQVQSVFFPNGARASAEYDSQGRLLRLDDGGLEAVDFAYDAPGSLLVTHATGESERLLANDAGQLAMLTDGLSRRTRLEYDDQRQLARMVGPAGDAFSFSHDDANAVVGAVDPAGAATRIAFEPRFGGVSTITDARGNTIEHEYDPRGNRTAIAYPGGATERWEYDAAGRISTWTNARGQRIRYTYDEQDLVTREELADGSERQFTYDPHRNLVAVTDARGTTAMEYDAADRLVRVTDPSGRFLRFAYDAGGHRIRSEDQDGFVLRYGYDASDRLQTVRDASDALLVGYTYDAAGRVVHKGLGHGGTTAYVYDGASQVLSVVNRNAGGTVLSRFDYTYDARGNCLTMGTVQGEWTYIYDSGGQLTRAVFASTDPDVASRDLAYEYDSVGNRVRTVENGATTAYTADNANQYAQVGPSAYTHDADGNLIARAAGTAAWAYTYDSENQLVAVAGPGGDWTFEYDAFGNRVAATRNGERTEYLVDPVGLGNVVATYDAGGLTARYVYGTGLVGRVDASGEAAFYGFDALGNATDLTAASGALLARYAYLPFGGRLLAEESVDNPFQYVGQHGVMRDGTGLHYMRSRYFDPVTGRFTQRDKAGSAGGLNLYAYVRNNPVNAIDPSGLLEELLLVHILNPTSPEAMLRKQLLDALVTVTARFNVLAEYVGHGLRRGYIRASGLYSTAELQTMVAATRAQVAAFEAQIAASSWGATLSRWGARAGNAARTVGRGIASAVVRHPLVASFVAGLAIGTGLRYVEGVDEAAQMTLVDLNDWLGGWLLWTPAAAELGTPIVSSHDPNDILGPAGYGAARWVASDVVLAYTIRFENDENASAPAQVVRVVQHLDPDLDFGTFELGSFGFGDLVVHVPPGRRFHSGRLDLRSSHGLFVDVTAEIDIETGIVTWELRSIDPATGLAPRDPFAGFLPPNETSPMGQGFVSYTIRAQPSVAGGQWIDAEARIFFDTNEPIDTPPHLNTLDAVAPSSQVEPLPATTYAPAIHVRWLGNDDGAGVATYDVYVSVDGGSFGRWLAAVADTTAVYPGQYGHDYGFYSVARDHTGRIEAPPPAADATTRVEPLAGDANCDGRFSAADLPAMMRDLEVGVPGACPSDADGDGDVDEDDLRLLYERMFTAPRSATPRST